MAEKEKEIRATGRRKTAVASVRLKTGKGKFEVNGIPMETYFNREALKIDVMRPLVVTGNEGKYDVTVKTSGGGIAGQAGATRHGLSRALAQMDEKIRHTLKQAGMLTRDQRMKERKKYGQPGARKRFQFSKR